uniref:Phosducin domain-containing protein n=1 Tax=Mycena chlorophos TaxID=658473 RepID=A0ABQ0KUT5_MYCCL|nr:predicted protein [Mycena chlorophos]
MDPLEELVLSGKLFSNSRSSSPERAPSPHDAGWHDDELNLSDDDVVQRAAFEKQLHANESIGMGPGRTGVKGVIRDRDEAEKMERDSKSREVAAMARQMERANLGGKTYLEEEREKGDNADEIVLRERARDREERVNVFGHTRQGRFGHLREVGVKGFLSAVEGETKGTWIVVHLYDPSLDRCYKLDERLAQLARIYPDTKFLRARASALGFTAASRTAPQFTRAPRKGPEDEDDDPYDEKDLEDEDEDEDDAHEDDVDLDMLPTMLVYRDSALVHNWVRVDWEAGQAGIDELLDRHHILPQSTHSHNLGLPSDDEDDDLEWSDDEDGLV